MSFFDCYLIPRTSGVTRFANILSVYSCYTLFTKERTSGEDFGMSHVSPFIVGFATTPVRHSSLFTLCDPWFSHQKGAKFLVAMVVHVTCLCACMGCEHKAPNCHEASLLVACLLVITLGPRTNHCADSDSVHNAFERARRASPAEVD